MYTHRHRNTHVHTLTSDFTQYLSAELQVRGCEGDRARQWEREEGCMPVRQVSLALTVPVQGLWLKRLSGELTQLAQVRISINACRSWLIPVQREREKESERERERGGDSALTVVCSCVRTK